MNPTKQCTKCNEIKELIEFHKHKRSKDGIRSVCKSCRSIYGKPYRKKYYEKNKEEQKEKSRKYSKEHRQFCREQNKEWRQKNQEYIKESHQKYRQNNKGKINGWTNKRRAARLQASPKLTESQLFEIESFYIKAARLTKETGIKHHVDHILPIQGNGITGFHVPWNLQILTGPENSKKNNSFDGTYENEGWRTSTQS